MQSCHTSAPDKSASPECFVYFIQCAPFGPVKIGSSANPANRIRDIQTASPHELRLLCVAVGSERDEKALHAVFAQERIRGEWFRPSERLMNEIERIAMMERSLGRNPLMHTAPSVPADDAEEDDSALIDSLAELSASTKIDESLVRAAIAPNAPISNELAPVSRFASDISLRSFRSVASLRAFAFVSKYIRSKDRQAVIDCENAEAKGRAWRWLGVFCRFVAKDIAESIKHRVAWRRGTYMGRSRNHSIYVNG